VCTVIISVPDDSSSPVRLLAVRDEDPGRPWDRLGSWWPQTHPGVIGIRDARAGGAWLAANEQARTLAVLLNRHDLSDRRDDEVTTRGAVALDAAAGRAVGDSPQTRGFNLVEVTAHTARVTAWDGLCSRTTELPPGIHMVAHDDVDDPETPRIARWLPEFQDAAPAGAAWWKPWLDIVERTADLPGDDPAAIIRRQSFEGVPSYSLLVCVASIGDAEFDVRDAPFTTPGTWTPAALR